MTRAVLIGVLCFVAGVATGALFVSDALVEPFDLLAWPYANRPVVTTAPLDARSGSNVLHLPAGTPLVLRHSAMGQQHFAVLLVGNAEITYPTADSHELRKLTLGGAD